MEIRQYFELNNNKDKKFPNLQDKTILIIGNL